MTNPNPKRAKGKRIIRTFVGYAIVVEWIRPRRNEPPWFCQCEGDGVQAMVTERASQLKARRNMLMKSMVKSRIVRVKQVITELTPARRKSNVPTRKPRSRK